MKKILRQTITNKTRILIPLLLLSLTLLLCLTTVSAAPGDAIYVTGSGDDSWNGQSAAWDGTNGPKKSIKNATGTVNTGGTIHIANGQYTGQNNTNITINKNMNIIGKSQTGTIINGTNTNWIFHINPNVNITITNLTLTNATADSGGAIYNQGNLTVNNCTFINNTATQSNSGGGAIYNEGTISSLSGCTFTKNAANEGGAINNDGTINSLSGCTFTNNNATYVGGAINNEYLRTINSLSGCTFTNNNATYGGAICNWNTINSLSGCTFTNNNATYGGAIYNGYLCTIHSLSGCTFTKNAANEGGAILNHGSCTVHFSSFTNNTATSGNAICCDGGSVNATLNWWGSNMNPKTISSPILVESGSVDASTWVILIVNANPTTINNKQTSTVTANLNHYIDRMGNTGTLTGHIPDGISVIFSLTGDLLGSFNELTSPVTLLTSEGLASISFNAASTGIQNIEAFTDNQKVATSITINEPASTGDFVWNDIDKDGIQDAGEPGIAGVTVNLYNSTGEIIATTTTDASGHYLFSNIIPGTYSVGFVLPCGYQFNSQDQGADDALDSDADVTTGRTTTTTLLSGENDLTWDAGMYMIPVAVDDTAT